MLQLRCEAPGLSTHQLVVLSAPQAAQLPFVWWPPSPQERYGPSTFHSEASYSENLLMCSSLGATQSGGCQCLLSVGFESREPGAPAPALLSPSCDSKM